MRRSSLSVDPTCCPLHSSDLAMTSEASKHLDSEKSTARLADETAPLIEFQQFRRRCCSHVVRPVMLWGASTARVFLVGRVGWTT
jgi:hypothetical protein